MIFIGLLRRLQKGHFNKQLMRVRKIDAAISQLQTAIQLFFDYGDPISIHTLVTSAHQILNDLSQEKSGNPSMMYQRLKDIIKPEFFKEGIELIRKPQNFFKHADRDTHNDILDFNPELTPKILLFTSVEYRQMRNKCTPLLLAFEYWFMIHNERLLTDKGKGDLLAMDPEALSQLKELGKQEFLDKAWNFVDIQSLRINSRGIKIQNPKID